MKTIYALFRSYDDASAAVEELVHRDFEREDINAIVQEKIAKNYIKIDVGSGDVATTDEASRQALHGLDALLGGQQAALVRDVGQVYAAGSLASVLTKTATSPDRVGAELTAGFVDFGVPQPAAEAFVEALREGGVLLLVRTSDPRAPEASGVLRDHKGTHINSYGT